MEEENKVTLVWESVENEGPIKPHFCIRAKVPGGWLVKTGSGITFYPDANHAWN